MEELIPLFTVVENAGDVPLERLALLVADKSQLLWRVGVEFDAIALGHELPVDEELLAGTHVDRRRWG